MLQSRATKADQGLGSLTQRKGSVNGVCSAIRRGLGETFSVMSQYLKGGYQGRCPFNKESHGKIMGNGQKVTPGKLPIRLKRETLHTKN